MKKIRVLIVEDEVALAELYIEFIKQHPYYEAIGVAHSIKDAKLFINKLSPDLILLDNYLPDGEGIDLLTYLASNKKNCYTIFLTAASDIEICSKAIQYGSFDYLIKPVSYERLKDSLNRFDLFIERQRNKIQLNQRQIDDLFNLYTKDYSDSTNRSKGIDDATLAKVQNLFTNQDISMRADEIAEKLGISKTTARRYLVYCVQIRFLDVLIQYGRVGRPERYYSRSKNTT